MATFRLESLLIPTFSETAAALYQLMFVSGRLWEPLLLSNQSLLVGYLLSVAVGVPLGLAMARARRIEQLADPYITVLVVIPTAPLIPIIMMAIGLDLASRVFVVFIFAFMMITVNTRAGVRNVDSSLIEMARSFGATEAQIWRKVLLPGALPAMFAGLRIGLGRAVTGMVIVELLLVAVGVGRLMLEFRGLFNADALFAVVLAVVLESVVLMAAMRWLELKLLPWGPSAAVD